MILNSIVEIKRYILNIFNLYINSDVILDHHKLLPNHHIYESEYLIVIVSAKGTFVIVILYFSILYMYIDFENTNIHHIKIFLGKC